MGKLVVIEGLDGSGKATQTTLLAEALGGGRKVRQVSFPNYKSHSSALVRMYLDGDFGEKPGDVNAYAASAFYAVDRYAGYSMDWGGFYRQGGLILADRYATSNAIHQCAKLPEAEWQTYVDWLEDFEYGKMGIPRPDLVLLLDVEPEVSQRLMKERYEKLGDGQDGRDIHERDLEYLQACRKAAHWCAKHLGWHVVVCSENGEMKSRDAIAAEILSIVTTEAL